MKITIIVTISIIIFATNIILILVTILIIILLFRNHLFAHNAFILCMLCLYIYISVMSFCYIQFSSWEYELVIHVNFCCRRWCNSSCAAGHNATTLLLGPCCFLSSVILTLALAAVLGLNSVHYPSLNNGWILLHFYPESMCAKCIPYLPHHYWILAYLFK